MLFTTAPGVASAPLDRRACECGECTLLFLRDCLLFPEWPHSLLHPIAGAHNRSKPDLGARRQDNQ